MSKSLTISSSVLNCFLNSLVLFMFACGNETAFVSAQEPQQAVREKQEPIHFHTNNKLRSQLLAPLTVSWNKAELREIIQQLEQSQRVAIQLDRRLNPNFKVSFGLENQPLHQVLLQISEQVGASMSIQPNYIYLGPPESSRLLRTLIVSQRETLDTLLETAENKAEFRHLKKRQTLKWEDLTSPQDLLRQTAEKYTLKIENLDQVPHDLWAKGTLPATVLEQQLCTILLQFNLTYSWTEPGKVLKLVPLPPSVQITRSYAVSLKKRPLIEEQLSQNTALTTNWVSNNRLELQGLVEEHEWLIKQIWPQRQFNSYLREATKRPNQQSSASSIPKISNRRFTIKQNKVPIQSVLTELQKSGILFEYDAQLFQELKIDLKTRVDLDLQQSPPRELCSQLFDEIGVKYEIQDRKIVLKPAQSASSSPE